MGKNLYNMGGDNKIGASNPNFVAERRGRRSLRKEFDKLEFTLQADYGAMEKMWLKCTEKGRFFGENKYFNGRFFLDIRKRWCYNP